MLWTVLYGGVVGAALGLTGGGGSIFAVPLLLYALGLSVRTAVTVSLAVVGLTSLYGAGLQRRLVDWRPGALFGVGGILGAPVGAWLGARMPSALTLLLLAALMVFIGARMWPRWTNGSASPSRFACRRDREGTLQVRGSCMVKLLCAGAATGILSGTFGVGGGFLVVPALLVVAAMPIERALATSLVCIALISGSAFVSNFLTVPAFPTMLAAWFFVGGAGGMTAGAIFKSRLSARLLKQVFAVAILAVALWIVTQTLLGYSPRRHAHRPRATPVIAAL